MTDFGKQNLKLNIKVGKQKEIHNHEEYGIATIYNAIYTLPQELKMEQINRWKEINHRGKYC